MEMLNMVYRQNPDVVHRNVLDEAILMPIKQGLGEPDAVSVLTETAAFVWTRIDGQRTVADICQALMDEYEVSLEIAQSDVMAFVKSLEQACFALPVESKPV